MGDYRMTRYANCVTKMVVWSNLSSCTTCLSQGVYRWRHDTILQSLTDSLEEERLKKRPKQTDKAFNFVREGQHPPTKAKEAKSILFVVDDWKMTADLDKKLIFPSIIHNTSRP